MKKHYVLAGTSILLWSTLATVSKLLMATMSSYHVLCVSAAFAAVVLVVYNLATGKLTVMRSYGAKDYLIMVLLGLPGTLFYNLFYYGGAAILPASQAFIINYLWPIMSVVFACIMLKEKLTGRKILAFVISFLGVATVAGGGLLQFEAQTLWGVLLCLGAAVSYGAYTALNQRWSYDKQVAVMVACASTFVLCAVVSLVMGEPMQMGRKQLAGLGWNGVCVMAVATTTWAMALDLGNTAKISNLAYITPFLSLVWTFLVLGEVPSPWAIGGLCLIVLGIFVQMKREA
ncbi:MAG: DMT family transporter [Oscillospiraceae bacterium]|nr:DMT family transporter [Oscillospiraceae bacterium]MBQ7088408.1 DMT family transporter [Clostridia bacterium]